MKNSFLLGILIISIFSIKSCRDQDIYSNELSDIPTQAKHRIKQETKPTTKPKDSIIIPSKPKQNDPDPPIKDGQDWLTKP